MTTKRVHNFSAGPAVLPEPVLAEAQRDLMALPGVGASVLEISHRSQEFRAILEDAKQRLTSLLRVPSTHQILFLQGGSRLQFSMVPMNLLRGTGRPADYIITGSWGHHARVQAEREGDVRVAYHSESTGYDRLPAAADLDLDPRAAYVHFTSNETIQGVQFRAEPEVADVPLVCDASSDFLSRPIPVERYGLIYACAQKNAGPAGVTVVIIRRDLLERSGPALASMLDYGVHAKEDSLYNTAPTFGIYVVGLVAKWLGEQVGGLEAMARQNRDQAQRLYDAIDNSNGLYQGHAQPNCRSMMNVTFRLPSSELERTFLEGASERGLVSLEGHRSVGGIRASIYNAMPAAGVQALRDYMDNFREQHAG